MLLSKLLVFLWYLLLVISITTTTTDATKINTPIATTITKIPYQQQQQQKQQQQQQQQQRQIHQQQYLQTQVQSTKNMILSISRGGNTAVTSTSTATTVAKQNVIKIQQIQQPNNITKLSLLLIIFLQVFTSALVSIGPASVIVQSIGPASASTILSLVRSSTAIIEIIVSPIIGKYYLCTYNQRILSLLYNTLFMTFINTIVALFYNTNTNSNTKNNFVTLLPTNWKLITTIVNTITIHTNQISIGLLFIARFMGMLSMGLFFVTTSSIIGELFTTISTSTTSTASTKSSTKTSIKSTTNTPTKSSTTSTTTNRQLSQLIGIQNALIRFGIMLGSLAGGYLSSLSSTSSSASAITSDSSVSSTTMIQRTYSVAAFVGVITLLLVQYGINNNSNNNNNSHTSINTTTTSTTPESGNTVAASDKVITTTTATTIKKRVSSLQRKLTSLTGQTTTALVQVPSTTIKTNISNSKKNNIPIIFKILTIILRSIRSSTSLLTEYGIKVRVLSIILMLQMAPMFAGDIFQIYATQQFLFTTKQFSTLIALLAIIGIVSDATSSILVPIWGIKTYTLIATISSLFFPLGIIVWGHPYGTIGGIILGVLGPSQTIGILSSLIQAGTDSGLPPGVLAGQRSSLLAILKVLCPILYSTLYIHGQHIFNTPTLPFVLNILLGIISLVLIQTYL